MKKTLLAVFMLSYLLSGAFYAYAQSTITPCGSNCNLGYTPLEPIPGVTQSNGTYDPTQPGSLPGIINAIFRVLITAGALIAVLSLTIGGVQYMTSSSVGGKNIGLERAQAALWGILLIAATWLWRSMIGAWSTLKNR